MHPMEYEGYYGYPAPTPDKIAKDKAKLAEFQAIAKLNGT